MLFEKEIWKDIPRFNGLYKISNFGNIKSIPRKINIPNNGYRITKEKIRKLKLENGYYRIHIGDKYYQVHRLVAETFIANPDNKACINHKDLNKLNNNIENLEWCTYKENNEHMRENIKVNYRCGENHPNSKLKKEQVLQIKNYIKNNDSNKVNRKYLSKIFNIDYTVICKIINNKSWKHLNG